MLSNAYKNVNAFCLYHANRKELNSIRVRQIVVAMASKYLLDWLELSGLVTL